MENAAKALMIAAGILLGIMLLSVMIYVFRQGAKVNQAYDNKQVSLQLELYNSQFEHYDRNNNNIMDVISLCNLAFDVNMDTDYDTQNTVEIEIQIDSDTYRIPNDIGPYDGELFNQRNKILTNSDDVKSIYSLVDFCPSAGDKLSTTKLKNGRTIYKYLFEVENPDDFQYHTENMKVSRIKLTAYQNPEWNI